MKKILVGAVVMLLLTGCGGKDTKTVCKSSLKQGIEIIEEINATGDKVTKMKRTEKFDFSDTSVYEDVTVTQIEDLAKELEKNYSGIDGISFKYKVSEDKKLEYTLIFDYEKADLEELQEKEMVSFEEDSKVKYISLKETVKDFETDGSTCEEQK